MDLNDTYNFFFKVNILFLSLNPNKKNSNDFWLELRDFWANFPTPVSIF